MLLGVTANAKSLSTQKTTDYLIDRECEYF